MKIFLLVFYSFKYTHDNYFKVRVWKLHCLNSHGTHFLCKLSYLVLIFFPCLLRRLVIFSLSAGYDVPRIVEIIEVWDDITFLQRELTSASERWLQTLVITDDLNLIRIWGKAECCLCKNYLFLVHSFSVIFRYPKNSLLGKFQFSPYFCESKALLSFSPP